MSLWGNIVELFAEPSIAEKFSGKARQKDFYKRDLSPAADRLAEIAKGKERVKGVSVGLYGKWTACATYKRKFYRLYYGDSYESAVAARRQWDEEHKCSK